ncbi:MAG: ABC transporter ATP-binding protein [Ferruginibacter sp.]|nr:ABC transporter ATP-binding protein [Ferruginibacter sp.]
MSQAKLETQIEFSRNNREVGVRLHNIGKRFNREWIFRHVDYEFIVGKKYAITGSNGSGKSTLLQVIAGSLTHNEGSVEVNIDELAINNDQHYQNISIATPYLELVEEMTALEMIQFHSTFKPLTISANEILQQVNLQAAANKQIRYYSSGMKQRLKLALAFFSNTPILLLDEPTTNLDEDGIALYHQLIQNHTTNKLVIVCSNDRQEYSFCEEVLEVGRYK